MLPESFEFIKKKFVCKGKAGPVTKVKLVNENLKAYSALVWNFSISMILLLWR